MTKTGSKARQFDPDDDLKTFTSWKLDLMKAVRADKKVSLSAASVFAAVMDFVRKDTKMAWPSTSSLAINLGTSTKTVKKHIEALIKVGWLERVGKANRGTIKYCVRDDRMNDVLDQVAIDLDRHRENERDRQSNRRDSRKAGPVTEYGFPASGEIVTEHGFQPEEPVSRNMGSELSRNMGSNEHLEGTPEGRGYEEKKIWVEEETFSEVGNAYARASKGC